MIHREKLQALAKVMGGQMVGGINWPLRGASWAEGQILGDGATKPGTKESLYAYLDEWVAEEVDTRNIECTRWGNGTCKIVLNDAYDDPCPYKGTELSCLVDAVLQVAAWRAQS